MKCCLLSIFSAVGYAEDLLMKRVIFYNKINLFNIQLLLQKAMAITLEIPVFYVEWNRKSFGGNSGAVGDVILAC